MSDCNPSELLSSARCFDCLTDEQKDAIVTELLCQISNGGSAPRVDNAEDSNTLSPNAENSDLVVLNNTQPAGTLTIEAPSGTPREGQRLIYRIKTTNVQTYSFDAIYRDSTSVPFPTQTTGGGSTDYLGFMYNATDDRWDLVASDAGH